MLVERLRDPQRAQASQAASNVPPIPLSLAERAVWRRGADAGVLRRPAESPEPVERGGAQVPDHEAKRDEKESRNDQGDQADNQHPDALAQPRETTRGKSDDPGQAPTVEASHGRPPESYQPAP